MSKSCIQAAKSGQDLRVIFMGMRTPFSHVALDHLIRAGVSVECIIVPALPASGESNPVPVRRLFPIGSPSEIPLINRFVEPTIIQHAWEHAIPVLEVARLSDPQTLLTLAAYRPDVISVACFNQRFPSALLTLPRSGCLNLHPSLLPAYRGPAPLFWVFRNGERETGITIHLMDEGLDTGDILLQERIEIPDGIRGDVLERQCAALGGELMATAIQMLGAGTASPSKQSAENSSTYPWPSADDFIVSARLSARRAYNFIRGVAYLEGPLEMHVAGKCLPIRDAESYASHATLQQPLIRNGDDLWVQCTPGVLHAKVRQGSAAL